MLSCNFEYGGVTGRLVSKVADMNRIVARRAEADREPRRQRVVYEESQAGATNGICLSSTAAAA